MTTILLGVVGSQAYGFAHAGSDTDYLGIFQRPTREILGRMNKGEIDADSRVSKDPDKQLHEVGKFFRLAKENNPNALELLWLPDESYEVFTLGGGVVVHNRDVFMSQHVRQRYVGYARSQVKRMIENRSVGNDVRKNGRHTARLLFQLRGILETGELTVRLSDEDVDEAKTMGVLAEEDRDVFIARVEELIFKLDNMDTSLPREPDVSQIREILVDLRLMELASGDPALT